MKPSFHSITNSIYCGVAAEWVVSNRPCSSHQQRKDIPVNKSELIEAVAKSAGLSKLGAERAIDGTLSTIKGALKKGQSVTLVGFGTFRVGKRAARNGRNPRTGAEIKIEAAKVPKFSAGKALKDAVN